MKLHIFILGILIAGIGTDGMAGNGPSIALSGDLESRQISVTVTPGLTSTRKLPRASLRQARRDMLAKHVVSDENLRALADHGDGLAALNYVRLLVSRHHGQPEHASDIAFYGAIAVGSGRVWPLADMVDAMRLLNPKTEPPARIRKYIKVLYAHAWAGNSLALQAVVDFNGEGRLFGKMSERTRARILEQSQKNGGARAEFQLAVELMKKPTRTADETELARKYLVVAAKSGDLAIKTTSENLLLLLGADGT